MRRTLCLLVVLLAVPLGAQTDAPAPFTDVESLRIQNVNLEGVILQRQLQDWEAKRSKLKADLEAARPGWSWNPDNGQWTKVPPKK